MEFLARVLIFLAAVIGVLAIGIALARRYRDDADEDGLKATDMLTKFQDLHFQGELSDEEFRTIKTKLADNVQDELRDTGETG